MVNTAQLTSALLLAMAPSALGGFLHAQNNCGFSIWCAGVLSPSAPGQPGQSSPIVQVNANSAYASPLAAENNNVGAVTKCSRNSNLSPVYQLEVTIDQGRSWVDLSAIDGSPFIDVYRRAKIPGSGCAALECAPGATNCEWPAFFDCLSTGDIYMTLC
ncbi:Uu.00g109180.m01.CDS01 [Anthostomella pinea]|uniref:Uu.00g109180.m01.CDS01 n=1 Tax=Anthostomella pinea TaxID=933095 RepID=A0AAI8YG60_9PEZI|nr:Uu.00g109180.m01.CDS01 [Anthostomella pinea]